MFVNGTLGRARPCQSVPHVLRSSSLGHGTSSPSPANRHLRKQRLDVPASRAASQNLQTRASTARQQLIIQEQQLLHPSAEPEPDSSELYLSSDLYQRPVKGPKGVEKRFVFVRHGHSTWNDESRIQGNSDISELTPRGAEQARLVRSALRDIQFDSCFASPHRRARQSTEIIWAGREAPMLFADTLQETDLGWFQGLRNEDIMRDHPEMYRVWRETPELFCLEGRYPVSDAFQRAGAAWQQMLAAPGTSHLVVTHKSIMRSLLCRAMGLPPRQFRSIDIANGAICMLRTNKKGDLLLSALNLTAHIHSEEVAYALPGSSANDTIAKVGA